MRRRRDPTGLNGATAPLAERLLFENRIAVIVVFALLTLFFGYQASQLKPDASFEKMIPTSHPYIQNYLDNRADLASLGNSIRIIVQSTEGDIFDKDFQEALQTDQRRGVLHRRRRPGRPAVNLDAQRSLERGHRGRLPRRHRDSQRLRRLPCNRSTNSAPTYCARGRLAAWWRTTSGRRRLSRR